MPSHDPSTLAARATAHLAARLQADKAQQEQEQVEQARQERVAAVRRTARQVAHHERGKAALLVPVAWLGALHTTAYLLHAGGVPWALRVLLVTLVAAAVLGVATRRGQDAPHTAVTAGVVWSLAAIAAGPSVWLGLALWVPGLLFWALPYWRAVLTRPVRQPPAAIEPAPRLGAEVALWAERVVPNNTVFKQTTLADVEPVPDGYSAIIIGEPGPTLFSKMSGVGAVETIASANRVRLTQVAVEPVDDGDASRARVTVIRSDQNLTTTVWLEDSGAAIDPATGIAQIGRYFDMHGAHRQFFTRSAGAQMGVVVGDTGSGKSAHVSALLALAHRSPLVATALLDPQSGSSQPDWSGRTPLYGEGHEATYEYLQLIDHVMVRRADYIAHAPWQDEQGRERSGKPFLLPGDPDLEGMSMMLVCVEELKFFLDGPFGKQGFALLATGVRTWRKAGGSLVVVNQNLGLDNFGNSQSFRANLVSGGSLAALRTGSSTDHTMVGLPADPSRLPEYFRDKSKTHGLGYLTGVDRRPAASWRAMPVRDAFGIATTPAAGQLGERTLGFIEQYEHERARGRRPVAAAPAETGQRTSGDVQATVEQVLLNGPMEVGAVCVAVRRVLGEVRLSEIPAALRTLTKAGRVISRGDLYHLEPTTTEGES